MGKIIRFPKLDISARIVKESKNRGETILVDKGNKNPNSKGDLDEYLACLTPDFYSFVNLYAVDDEMFSGRLKSYQSLFELRAGAVNHNKGMTRKQIAVANELTDKFIADQNALNEHIKDKISYNITSWRVTSSEILEETKQKLALSPELQKACGSDAGMYSVHRKVKDWRKTPPKMPIKKLYREMIYTTIINSNNYWAKPRIDGLDVTFKIKGSLIETHFCKHRTQIVSKGLANILHKSKNGSNTYSLLAASSIYENNGSNMIDSPRMLRKLSRYLGGLFTVVKVEKMPVVKRNDELDFKTVFMLPEEKVVDLVA